MACQLILWIWIYTSLQNTCNVTRARHISFTWCAFKNKPYMTACLSVNEHLGWWELCWTVLRALCPCLSLWRFNTLILGVSESVSVLVHVPMSLCTGPSVVEGFICWDSWVATAVLSDGDTEATLKLVLAVVKEGA